MEHGAWKRQLISSDILTIVTIVRAWIGNLIPVTFWQGLIRSSLWAHPSTLSYFQHLTFHTDSKGWLKLQLKIRCHNCHTSYIRQKRYCLGWYMCTFRLWQIWKGLAVRNSLFLDLNRSASLESIWVIWKHEVGQHHGGDKCSHLLFFGEEGCEEGRIGKTLDRKNTQKWSFFCGSSLLPASALLVCLRLATTNVTPPSLSIWTKIRGWPCLWGFLNF